jgi:PleD family two-component response regulator
VTAEDKVNILLVDDQPARLMSYDAILSVLGQNLVHARSGTEALQRLMESGVRGHPARRQHAGHGRLRDGGDDPRAPAFREDADHLRDGGARDRSRPLKGYELGAVDYVYVPVVPEILRGKVEVWSSSIASAASSND